MSDETLKNDGRFAMKVKRGFDLLVCLLLTPLILPLFVVVAIAIKLDGGPVFFNASRAGKHKRNFLLLKFRSMVVNADEYLDEDGRPTRDRVTKIGKLLRRFSVDELPQVINVLKGEMSIIGPRPILPKDADSIDPKFESRFDMLPGLTGLAQVSGRNTLPWNDRYMLDVKYVETFSLKNDLAIFVKTFLVVLTGHGMVADRNPDLARNLKDRSK